MDYYEEDPSYGDFLNDLDAESEAGYAQHKDETITENAYKFYAAVNKVYTAYLALMASSPTQEQLKHLEEIRVACLGLTSEDLFGEVWE